MLIKITLILQIDDRQKAADYHSVVEKGTNYD